VRFYVKLELMDTEDLYVKVGVWETEGLYLKERGKHSVQFTCRALSEYIV